MHVTLAEENANTRSQQTSSFEDTVRSVSSAFRAASGLNSMASSATLSRSSNIAGTIVQEPGWVQLEFKTIEDKTVFETAFDALGHQHGPLLKEEKLRPDHQSSKEQGSLKKKKHRLHPSSSKKDSLKKKYFWAAGDLHLIPLVAQESANTETKAFYEAKAEHADTLRKNLPQSLPLLAGYSSSHNDKRPDLLASSLDRTDLGIGFDGRHGSSYRSDAWLQNTIGPSIEGETTQPSLLRHKAILNDDRRFKEGSEITSFNFGTDTTQVSSYLESEVSASSISETSGCEKQGSTSETQVDSKIRRASIETSAGQERWRRRICRRIIVFLLWKREQDVGLPDEFWSSPASFEFINVLEVSPFDKIKGFLETYTGMEWDWWPFDPTAKPLESGKVRITWRCVGELSSDNTIY